MSTMYRIARGANTPNVFCYDYHNYRKRVKIILNFNLSSKEDVIKRYKGLNFKIKRFNSKK